MEVIDLGKFVKTPTVIGGTYPYAMYFMYTPEGNFLVKGMSLVCEAYVKEHFLKYIARCTFWEKGTSRGCWVASKGIHVSKQKSYKGERSVYKGRLKYVISMYGKEGKLVAMKVVRRMPRKWLDEYNQVEVLKW